jgi:hypothetical protein
MRIIIDVPERGSPDTTTISAMAENYHALLLGGKRVAES